MSQEKQFIKTLEEVRLLALRQGNRITKQQIEACFETIGIGGEQLEPVFEYLKERKIGLEEAMDPDTKLDDEEKNYLGEYLESLQELPKLQEGQKRAIGMAAMAGDVQGKEQILQSFLPQVVDLARLYAGQGVYLEDLIGEGNVALAAGVEMLGCLEDPSEIDTMLGKLVMNAMEEAVRENDLAKQADSRVEERVNRVSEAATELSESLRRKVTVKELAEEMEIDKEEILEVIRMCGGSMETIDSQDTDGEQ